jgi:4-amino-4-deoxy-L-arabinose transferase-like glycosyltransferase
MKPSHKILSLFFLGSLLILSFYIRFKMVSSTDLLIPLQDDAAEHYIYAYNLRHHQVYSRDVAGLESSGSDIKPDALRNPGYPLLLSIFLYFPLAYHTVNLILFVQVIISTLTVVIAYFIYKRYLQRGWAELAAILTAISPHLVAMNIYLLTETLFCLALCGAAWAFTRLVHRPLLSWSLILGAILGLANLTRPSLLFFPFLLSIFILWQFKSRQRAKLALMVLIGFFIVMAPWHIRNLVALERWSDDRLQINFLHHGIYPDFMYNSQKESYRYPYQFDPRSEEISRSTESVLSEIVDRFRREPIEHIAWYLLRKPMAFWSWDIVQGQGDVFVYAVSKTPYWDQPIFSVSHGFMRSLHALLVLLGLLGCVMAWLPAVVQRLSPGGVATARFISLLLTYYTALHMLGFPEPRYSIPLRPFLYGMSLFAASMMWAHVRFRLAGRHAIQATAVHGGGNLS